MDHEPTDTSVCPTPASAVVMPCTYPPVPPPAADNHEVFKDDPRVRVTWSPITGFGRSSGVGPASASHGEATHLCDRAGSRQAGK